MISLKGVHKSFGRFHAVRDASFEIARGEVVGLLGPNGAGKTTTIRMITGYLPPTAGRVEVCGHDSIKESLKAREMLGYLPEATPLYPEMRVSDYLLFRSRLYSMKHRERRPAVERALTRCWLGDVASRRISQLSKGYRQRVGLAAALLHNPRVLILDEPANGLDPTQIQETRKLIRELSKERTVLVSSHILPEVERTCDRVIIMSRGRVRADGTPERLLHAHENRHPPVHCVEVLADTRTSTLASDQGWSGEISRIMNNLKAIPGVASVRLDTMTQAAPAPLGPPAASTSDRGAGVGGGSTMRGTPRGAQDDPSVAFSHWFTLRVTPIAGFADLREPMARTLARGHVLCRDLRRETPTLEQLFTSMIEEEPGEPGAGTAAA